MKTQEEVQAALIGIVKQIRSLDIPVDDIEIKVFRKKDCPFFRIKFKGFEKPYNYQLLVEGFPPNPDALPGQQSINWNDENIDPETGEVKKEGRNNE